MVGSIQIDNTASGSITYDDTSTCRTRGGLSDITAGTAVTVQDSHGQTIATGALESGSPTITTMSNPALGIPPQPFLARCTFTFRVPDVPDGLSEYLVLISHRGTHVVSAAEAHGGVNLSLTPGP